MKETERDRERQRETERDRKRQGVFVGETVCDSQKDERER